MAMALETEDLARLRRAIDELTTENYSDEMLQALFLSFSEDFNLTVSAVWDEKAAQLSMLVDTSEGQSSRKMSQASAAALKMSATWRARSDATGARGTGRARTRPIERV
jgi:hypothetical protein